MSAPDPEARRVRYLRTMGITAWVRRDRPFEADIVEEADTVAHESAPSAPAPAAHLPRPESRESPASLVSGTPVAELDWETLQATVSACQLCPLAETRSNTVFGVGAAAADWMIIGEAPGAEEDRRGEPFVGRAGQLLDSMLAGVSQSRATAYIANVIKCRPPDNRDPSVEEANCCAPYLERQIELIQPRVILAVGRVAAQRLLGQDVPVGRLRGQIHHFGPRRTPLIVTYHPAYLLRRPSEKGKVWRDLLLARSLLEKQTA
ncbi:MAG: uracil-DNA glycosylase [Gammaproteobacteria bacterium]